MPAPDALPEGAADALSEVIVIAECVCVCMREFYNIMCACVCACVHVCT